MSENITPLYNLIPSSEIPGGITDTSDSTSVMSSGTMISPKKEPLGEMIGPMAATANILMLGSGDDSFNITSLGIWLGAANFADAPFSVDMQGNVIALSGVFKGAVSAATIDIGGTDATSFHVDINGNMWSGAANFADAPFSVTNAGVIKGISGTIGGWTIGSTTLVGGNITLDQANDKITVGASNGIVINGATGKITSNDGTTWTINGDGTTTGFSLFTNGTTTKAVTDASTTQNITHSLGLIPKNVKITAVIAPNVAVTHFRQSMSVYNGTTQSSFSVYGANNGVPTVDNNFRLGTNDNTAGANYQEGVITFNATNIIIAWTKTGTPSGTYTIVWQAEA